MTEPAIAADTYARWRASTLGLITERVEIQNVLELAGPLAGKRVLDVGTGDGTYALEAAARGAIVTGIDLDPTMLAAARTRANERGLSPSFVLGRAEALPFPDGAFDVVFAVTVLCLVSDARVVAREMARVLAPGGRLVIGELVASACGPRSVACAAGSARGPGVTLASGRGARSLFLSRARACTWRPYVARSSFHPAARRRVSSRRSSRCSRASTHPAPRSLSSPEIGPADLALTFRDVSGRNACTPGTCIVTSWLGVSSSLSRYFR